MPETSDKNMLGIDLGNWCCHVIDDFGFPSNIDFGFLDVHAKTQISQIKCLLGRKFSDPELQSELDYVPFRVIEGPDGCPLVHGTCKGVDRAFTPVEILAMLIYYLESLAREKYSDSSPSSPCIVIPIYFTDQQKKDIFQAAKIAGLSPSVVLLNETEAMVMVGVREILLTPQSIGAFVDIGHTSMQVCFAEFQGDCSSRRAFERTSSMNILYKGYARSLGGREFHKVLFNHFASKIRKEYNIDVPENCSACVRLSETCERLKKDLNYCYEASFCLVEFSDSIVVKGSITRTDFLGLCFSILKKIEVALKKALSESGLNVENIDFIETVGKGCSIHGIFDILTRIFGKQPRKQRIYEHVARGCSMLTRQHKRLFMKTAGPETSELVSIELNSEEKKAEDSEKFLRKRTMDEDGHLLIVLDEFLEETEGTESSEFFSRKFNSEEEKVEDSEKFLCRRAMDEGGHHLTFLNDFLEENMHYIGRSEKTKDESYWLSKANSSEYSYSELQDATNNFHESFKLGEGGFGIVYKGNLNKYKTVAIKILKEGSSQGAKEFNQEVEILSKVRHPNLVKLIGACAETRALVYQYLPNGSLEDRLQCKRNTPALSWQAQVRIAFEICSALSFLHCSEPHGIVHGDLKPENILLDRNDKSNICDFGLCRELNFTASASIPYHWTDCPKGTFAYMDPEYFSTGQITPQYDVYSFGILLLRLATCKNPQGIRQLVEEAKKKGTMKTLIDASAGPWPFKKAKKMISLGLRCSDPMRKNRPDLSTEVLKEIKSILQDSESRLSRAPSLFRW